MRNDDSAIAQYTEVAGDCPLRVSSERKGEISIMIFDAGNSIIRSVLAMMGA